MDSRIETLLDALVNDKTLPEDYRPMSRNEAYLYALWQKGIGGSNSNQEWDLELSIYDEGLSLANIAQNTDKIVVERGSIQDCVNKIINGQPVKSVLKCVNTYNGVPSNIQIIPMYYAGLGYANGRLLGITGVDCTGDVVSINLKTDNSIFDAYYSSK